MKINVEVCANTFGTHVHQVFCGLVELNKEKIICLSYRRPPQWFTKRPTKQLVLMRVIIGEGQKWICIDLNDHFDIASSEALKNCDVYFKRSYLNGAYEGESAHKIRPFGFNYQIMVDSYKDFFCRAIGEFFSYPYLPFRGTGLSHTKEILKYFKDLSLGNYVDPQILRNKSLMGDVSTVLSDYVLFQCRLWDPLHFPLKYQNDIKDLNSVRVDTIKMLRERFGVKFIGGLQRNSYVEKKDINLISPMPTGRHEYIELVKRAKVVVTTNGISESIGWKMGEFVALSKAIVCEPLKYDVPGGFSNGLNYIQYQTPEECAATCEYLMSDDEANQKIRSSNADYYEKYLAPSKLVLHCLEK